ncbi:MAG: hypothetical protein IPM54_10430 [Polyangiaceae bacterium]|nr:hypothetical protein [Polyangiaceae bacterium]
MEEKDESKFNTEHVIPRSFGVFENNLVLKCVCKKCNDLFGSEFDEKLARDSIEAPERVRAGLKEASKFQTRGKRSTLQVRINEEGPLKGAYAFYVPGGDERSLNITLAPQVGFAESAEGPFEWFLLDDIPTKDELTAQGYGRDTVARSEGCSIERAQEVLEARGYARGTMEAKYQHANTEMLSKTLAQIGELDFRAISKIAFNYFAATQTAGIARMPEFNDIRRFIRYGIPVAERLVEVRTDPGTIERASDGTAARGHYLTVQTSGHRIIAQVSLLLRLRYVVTLSRTAFVIPYSPVSAHFFDLDTRRPALINPPPLF